MRTITIGMSQGVRSIRSVVPLLRDGFIMAGATCGLLYAAHEIAHAIVAATMSGTLV